jgi:hypothetical protein
MTGADAVLHLAVCRPGSTVRDSSGSHLRESAPGRCVLKSTVATVDGAWDRGGDRSLPWWPRLSP